LVDRIFVSQRNIEERYLSHSPRRRLLHFRRYERQKTISLVVNWVLRDRLGSSPDRKLVTVVGRLSATDQYGSATHDALPSLKTLAAEMSYSPEFGTFLGSVLGDGHIRYYCYHDGPINEDKVEFRIFEFNEHSEFNRLLPFSYEVSDDPEGKAYREFLAPRRKDMFDIAIEEQLALFRKAGDPGRRLRAVRHVTSFPDVHVAEEFKRVIQPFIDLEGPCPTDDDEVPFRVVAQRVMDLHRQHIWADAVSVDEAAREAGGLYEGWEARVQVGSKR